MATLPTLGFPSDTLGVNGDAAQDLQNRVIYFPKANNTWSGVAAYSFQGPVGPSLLVGVGAPAAALGSPGQGYADLSSAGTTYVKNSQNTWVAAGQIIGAQGVAGPSGQSVPSLTSTSYVFGPNAANGTAIALSASNQNLPTAGTTQPWYFIPSVATTFAGGTFVLSSANSPGSVTFNLYDLTAGTSKYTYTISTFGTVSVQTASVALTTGNTHTWYVAGSGNAFAQASAVFTQPASAGISTPYGPLFASTFSTAPTSATPLYINSNNAVAQYMGLPKTGFLYSAQFVNTSSSTATFGLYNSGGTLLYSTNVSSNQTTPALVGPFPVNQTVLSSGYYLWRVTCSATGYFSVLPQISL